MDVAHITNGSSQQQQRQQQQQPQQQNSLPPPLPQHSGSTINAPLDRLPNPTTSMSYVLNSPVSTAPSISSLLHQQPERLSPQSQTSSQQQPQSANMTTAKSIGDPAQDTQHQQGFYEFSSSREELSDPKPPGTRKRRRIPVSCAVCRQRKLKCNRMQPCSGCVRHGTVDLCVYAVKPWIAQNLPGAVATISPSSSSSSPSSVPATHLPDNYGYSAAIPGTQTFSMTRSPGKTSQRPLTDSPMHQQNQQHLSERLPGLQRSPQPGSVALPSYSNSQVSHISNQDSYRTASAVQSIQDEIAGVQKATSGLSGGMAPLQEYNELKNRMERLESMIQRFGGSGGQLLPGNNNDHSIKLPPIRDDLQSSASEGPAVNSESPRTGATAGTASQPYVFAPEPRLRAHVTVKKNRFSFHGPFTAVTACKHDAYLAKYMACDDMKKAKSPFKKMLKEKKHSAGRPGKHEQLAPETEEMIRETLDTNADLAKMFPRLEHRDLCEYLITRFLQTINLVFPIVHPTSFRAAMMKYWEQKWKFQNGTAAKPAPTDTTSKAYAMDKKLHKLNKCSSQRKEHMRGTALMAILLKLGRMACGPNWTPSKAGFDDKYAPLFEYRLKDFAWKCLNETSYLQKSDFVALQVLLGIRVHNMLASEVTEGPDTCDSGSFSGLLCQVALTMGLHRDPDQFPQVPPDLADAWRIMWAEILSVDTDRSLCIAVPFAISTEMSDTLVDKLRPFQLVATASEQPSVHFLHCKVQFNMLARSILSRLLLPDLELQKTEFDQHMAWLSAFEEKNLSSFQLLVEMINADTDPAVSGPQDSYDLTQKYILQLQFLRLQLSLLRSYAPKDEAEQRRVFIDRLRCAEKLLDTIVTCTRRPQLFSGFMPLIIPLSLRHFPAHLITIYIGILRQIGEQPASVAGLQGIVTDENWRTPDMAFKYDDRTVCDIKRLYQTASKICSWIESESETNYSALRMFPLARTYLEACKDAISKGGSSASVSSNQEASNEMPLTESPNAGLTDDTGSLVSPKEGQDWADALTTLGLDPAEDTVSLMGDGAIGEWWHDWSVAVEDALFDDMDIEHMPIGAGVV
ncbi:hypothetical protein BZA70DRAFT_278683 [Myxozyma melibiosi]|uniref:Zn(2)-C6 fungal-type domain-containing protein n=1 Tax=Myxozyma melibiosi TaxID=54550 RepID=A0ABR1F541_9ASCO